MNRVQFFDNIKFYETKRGYFLGKNPHTGKPIWMHQYVWEFYNGNIPKDYHVHHIDRDRSNNDITNLELIRYTIHLSVHSAESFRLKVAAENLKQYAVPAAAEWHKSESGRLWHKQHFEAFMRDKFSEKVELICEYCGNPYQTSVLMKGRSRFCSNNCKSAYRRKSETDNITVFCEKCGNEFSTNRYLPRRFCSDECKNASVVGKRKNVVRYSTDGILIARYRSAAEAAKSLNIHPSKVSRYCTGKTKHPSGEKWCYESGGDDIV